MSVRLMLVGIVLALSMDGAVAKEKRVKFDQGASEATVTATIQGYDDMTWVVGARAGQTMVVEVVKNSSTSAYFNVTQAGSDSALFNGSIEGDRFEAVLPADGDYRVMAYLMRNAARRDELAKLSLRIVVRNADFADGLMGGPDWWSVEGLAAGDTLNLRAGPSTKFAVLMTLENGDVLKNEGCTMTGSTRWCKLSSKGVSGWAAGKYLRESGGP